MRIKACIFLLSIVLIFLLTDRANAHNAPLPEIWSGPFPILFVFENNFIRYPAMAGDITLGVGAGMAGLAIGIPVGIIFVPFTNGISIIAGPAICMALTIYIGRMVGAGVVGAPFYIAQKAFYDLPKWLFSMEEIKPIPQK